MHTDSKYTNPDFNKLMLQQHAAQLVTETTNKLAIFNTYIHDNLCNMLI